MTAPTILPALSLADVRAARRFQQENKLRTYYPEAGPYRRELYVKHMQFFEAGTQCRERAFIAGNRVGKTEGVGAYEVTLHATGNYPAWWKGKRFSRPVNVWAAGDTNQTVRDILQAKLLGKITRGTDDRPDAIIGLGTGMIPKRSIRNTKPKAGIPDAIEVAYIKHASGGTSTITFKTYEQGRVSFQGTEQDIIWCDEEPPEGVYDECAMRTMATGAFEGGIIILTFTPLEGWTNVIERFLNEHQRVEGKRFVVQAGWDDAPHLSKEEKEELLAKLPPHQRDARTKGIPQLGSGAIYPVPESEIACDPFSIPDAWPRGFALDVGWNRTAAVFGALDPQSDILYLYSLVYISAHVPSEVVRAIQARGKWIPGVIDPAARGRSQKDGSQLIKDYEDLGLDIEAASNTVDSGLLAVWDRMVAGRLKVFRSLADWFNEFRVYRRDEKGRIVKQNDHAMDGTRYLVVSGIRRFRTQPAKRPIQHSPVPVSRGGQSSGHNWMS